MVTVAYIITMVLLAGLTAVFDMVLFKYGFVEALKNLYYTEVFVGRMFVAAGVLIGFAFSITADIRVFKNRRKGSLHEES